MGIDFSKLQFVGEPNVTKENGGITCEELFKVGSIWKNKNIFINVFKFMLLGPDGTLHLSLAI